MHQRSTLDEQKLTELFNQFKFHLIYENKPKDNCDSNLEQLKNLLSQVKQQSNAKRLKKQELQKSLKNKTKTTHFRAASSLSRLTIKRNTTNECHFDEVKTDILVIQKQKQNLDEEINRLQNSVGELKKNLRNIRKQADQQKLKEQKFKHVSYLAQSIQRNTDCTKLINHLSFKKMMKYQEETLGELKQFKIALRKENEDLETRFIHQPSKMSMPTSPRINRPAKPQNCIQGLILKIDKPFMNMLSELMKLFISKQQCFQQIKGEQTTKIRFKKIKKNYLKQDRMKFQKMVESFQQKYDVKTQSLANLVRFLFKKLSTSNQELQNQCIKLNEIKSYLLEDLQSLQQRQKSILRNHNTEKIDSQSEGHDKKRSILYYNSQIFIQLLALFHNLIEKFKHLFTIALPLSIDKKNFQDLLIKIGKKYRSDSIFYQEDWSGTYQQKTTLKEMQIILDKYGANHQLLSREEFLHEIFSDLRYSLIFRRGEIEDQIWEGEESQKLLEKIQNIIERCEDMYEYKLKTYSHLIINAIKSLYMNKYQRKMVASSNASNTLFFPQPIKSLVKSNPIDFDVDTPPHNYKQQNKFSQAYTQQEQQAMEFTKNPKKIVQLLQKLRNEQKTSFCPMTFSPPQVYMYNSKIALPKYAV